MQDLKLDFMKIVVKAINNSILNPILFIIWLFVGNDKKWGISEVVGSGNIYTINLPVWILASMLTYLLAVALTYAFKLQFVAQKAQASVAFNHTDYLISHLGGGKIKTPLWVLLPHLLTLLVLSSYATTGMEMNIMGFFGAPMLLIASLIYLLAAVRFIIAASSIAAALKLITKYSPARFIENKNILIQWVFFAIFNPILILMIMFVFDDSKGAASQSATASVFSGLIIMLLFYSLWLLLCSVVFKVLGAKTSWLNTLRLYFKQAPVNRALTHIFLILALVLASLPIGAEGLTKDLFTMRLGMATWPLILMQGYGVITAVWGTLKETRQG